MGITNSKIVVGEILRWPSLQGEVFWMKVANDLLTCEPDSWDFISAFVLMRLYVSEVEYEELFVNASSERKKLIKEEDERIYHITGHMPRDMIVEHCFTMWKDGDTHRFLKDVMIFKKMFQGKGVEEISPLFDGYPTTFVDGIRSF